MPTFRTRLFVFLVLIFALIPCAWAQLTVTDDTYVSGVSPTQANGSSTALVVQGSTSGKPSLTYVRFDLSSLAGIQNSQIQKATLRLYVNAITAGGGFDIVEVTSPTGWVESTLTYNTPGASSPTGASLATNIQASYPASKYVYILVDVTSAVQDWLNGATNNGLVLKPHDTNISVSFSSKEDTTYSHEPSLIVVVKPGFGANSGVQSFNGRTGLVTPQDNDYTFGMINAGQNTRALVIGPGGSLTTSGGGTIAATSVLGTGVSGDISGRAASITGSISESQVTNLTTDLGGKVSLSGSYPDPTWITTLSGSKISSAVANATHATSADSATNATNAANLTGNIQDTQVNGLTADLTNAAAGAVTTAEGYSDTQLTNAVSTINTSLAGKAAKGANSDITSLSALNSITANQSAAGANVFSGKRADDNNATGDFLNFTKMDGTTPLFQVDVTGRLTTGTVPYANLSGAPTALPPSGAAGGDLAGNYPNPTLSTVGTSGTYTKVTTDSKGRVTSGGGLLASDIPDLSATYDLAGAASTAQTNAQNFAAGAANTAQNNAETFATGAANTAQANAQNFATSAANTAQNNAETFATGAANTAQTNAEAFATTAATTAAAGAVTTAEGYSDTQLTNAVSTINTSLAGKAAKGANSDITSLSALNSITANQSAAGANVFSGKRADDNNATGDFLNFTKMDGTTPLFQVDVTGRLTTGTVPYANLSGAPTALPPSGAAGGDLAGNYPNPTLSTVGTSGTYTKVTTDSKGRVTSGGGLLAGDIPNIAESQVTNLSTDLAAKESTANKNQPNGYAGLDASSKIGVSQIPSLSSTYVDLSTNQTIGGTKTFSSPISGSVTGSAASVTGNVAGSQITGNISGNAASITGSITESQVTNLTSDLASKAPLASPALTGNPTAPTPATADNSTSIATTAFVKAQGYVTSSSAPVTSVFGRSGAVAAQSGDYSFDKIAAGSNTSALTVGTGGSLAPTGTGTVTANVLTAATYSNVLNFNNAGNSFTGNGSALTSLNASNLSGGTVPAARLNVQIVTGTAITSANNPGAGTTVTATASCSTGAMLSGGANVTATVPAANLQKVQLVQSYPSAANTWTATAVVNQNITGSNTVTVQAYVICAGS